MYRKNIKVDTLLILAIVIKLASEPITIYDKVFVIKHYARLFSPHTI